MNSPVQAIAVPEKDLIDRIADSLPADVRADYYREMRHCRSLSENDEMLRILRAMQFLTLLIHQAPARLATEREQLDLKLDGCVSSLMTIEKRLDALPEGVSSKIGPDKVAARINESLRQQFFETTIPQSGEALAFAAAQLKRSVAEFVTTMREINNKYDGAATEARAAIDGIQSSIAFATRTSKEATESQATLVVCATHDEIDRVTEAIRDHRKKTGELGQSTTLNRHVSLGWTAAQKTDYRNFRPGQILEFHRAVKDISKHESTEVLRADNDGVVVRTPAGIERTLTSKQANSFDVMEAKPIDVAPGDRLLLTGNRREGGLRTTNGELVTVTAVDSAGRIYLEDGRTLPADYRSFAHGYAVTAHRSQGKSVDAVIISADGMRKELFYVAASRGRESIMIIASDKERLIQTVSQTAARKSASELVRGTPHRGLAMARELIRAAVRVFNTIQERLAQQVAFERRKEHQREHTFDR